MSINLILVDGFNPFEKYQLDHETPRFGVKIPKMFELPPPSECNWFKVGDEHIIPMFLGRHIPDMNSQSQTHESLWVLVIFHPPEN